MHESPNFLKQIWFNISAQDSHVSHDFTSKPIPQHSGDWLPQPSFIALVVLASRLELTGFRHET
jgi:hypothetical protein